MEKKLKQAIVLLLESRLIGYSEATVHAWYTILKDEDYESVSRAMRHFITENLGKVTTALIIEKAKEYRIEAAKQRTQVNTERQIEAAQGADREVWAERFGKLAEKIKNIGAN